jgi:hypothetical protein
MTDYVTQGTVQVEIESAHLLIRINPNQDYAVKHNEKSYIIFMPKDTTLGLALTTVLVNAKILEKSSKEVIIHGQNDDRLAQALTKAAFDKTNIEIVVDIDQHDNITVKSIKIPATLRSDTV